MANKSKRKKTLFELKKKYILHMLKRYSKVRVLKEKENPFNFFMSNTRVTRRYKPILESFLLLFLKNGKKHLSKKILIKILIELRILINSKLKYPIKVGCEDILMQAAYNSRLVVTLQRIKMRRKFLYIPYFIRNPRKQIYSGLRFLYKQFNSKLKAKAFAKELWGLAFYTSSFIKTRNELHRSVYRNRRFLKRRWPLYYTKKV